MRIFTGGDFIGEVFEASQMKSIENDAPAAKFDVFPEEEKEKSRSEEEKRITTTPTSTPRSASEEGKPASSSNPAGKSSKKIDNAKEKGKKKATSGKGWLRSLPLEKLEGRAPVVVEKPVVVDAERHKNLNRWLCKGELGGYRKKALQYATDNYLFGTYSNDSNGHTEITFDKTGKGKIKGGLDELLYKANTVAEKEVAKAERKIKVADKVLAGWAAGKGSRRVRRMRRERVRSVVVVGCGRCLWSGWRVALQWWWRSLWWWTRRSIRI